VLLRDRLLGVNVWAVLHLLFRDRNGQYRFCPVRMADRDRQDQYLTTRKGYGELHCGPCKGKDSISRRKRLLEVSIAASRLARYLRWKQAVWTFHKWGHHKCGINGVRLDICGHKCINGVRLDICERQTKEVRIIVESDPTIRDPTIRCARHTPRGNGPATICRIPILTMSLLPLRPSILTARLYPTAR
jgi:hypothetical protein